MVSATPWPVLPEDPQLNEPATSIEVIEITNDNGDDQDQADKAVPRPKTPVHVTATDNPATGNFGRATDTGANATVPIKQGSPLNTLALAVSAVSCFFLRAVTSAITKFKRKQINRTNGFFARISLYNK